MAMALGSGSNDERPKPVVNVTPLVDIALVVLIIFMVVTPMMMKTFWLNVPKKDEQAEKDKDKDQKTADADKPLVMTVGKDGVIRVNQTVLDKGELDTRLARMLAAKDKRVLYFDAHDDLPYGDAVEIMDLSRAGGARSIAILTDKLAQ